MKFNEITTRNELADFLGIPRKLLLRILYNQKPENLYRTFEIKKKSGGVRQINAPEDELKSVQRKLANALTEYRKEILEEQGVYSLRISHGFERGKTFITNAKVHVRKRFVLNIDLENFFDSFHFGRVCGFFEKNMHFQLPREVAIVIAQLTCYNGRLPQGAPSSPIITNLICQILDVRLLNLVKKYKVDYTRYADDLTFSTNEKAFLENHQSFLAEIKKEIEKAGFTINDKKTRLQYKDSRQEVTGLVVNRKVSVNHTYCKKTRAMAHNLYVKGSFEIDGEKGTMNQLQGRFVFINHLDKLNNKHFKLEKKPCTLKGREKAYQHFLFYKYFFANEKPLIVTEGKTDILYLKAALKSLYLEYPDLVGEDKKGFHFKVSFLNRTKRLAFFLNLKKDGADTMMKVYNFYKGKHGYENLYDRFNSVCVEKPANPVILLYDNEAKKGKTEERKPLAKFISHVKLDDAQKEDFLENLWVKLIEESNLFLATNPLAKDSDECEIEHLFHDSVLKREIDGKVLSREPEAEIDASRVCSKHDFAKYVYTNYHTIEFGNFRPLLDAINEMVQLYK